MYDKTRADRAVNFIQSLKHIEGVWAGVKFNLMPWQEKIIRDIFGTLNKDGTRQYRTAYIEIPRKNGKTELGSAIALYLLFADSEMGSEIYSAAGDRQQASQVYKVAAPMVRQAEALASRSKIIDSQKRIVYYKNNSFYQVISAESKTKHGFNAHGIIFDELHIQPNRDLWDVLTTSGGTRTQPLVFAITTAGFDRNSICWEQHDYALKILNGIIKDDTFYPVVFGADENDDWEDEKVWYKVNPALGVFRSLEEMRALYNKAKETPALQNTFRRLYLNQWTTQETRAIEMDKWDGTAGIVIPEDLKGKTCYGGLDLATSIDLASFTMVFPVGDYVHVIPKFFIPEDTMREKEKKDRVPYSLWVKQGFVYATPGNVIDFKFIKAKIEEFADYFDIAEIGYDPWNSSMLVQALIEQGMKMIPVRQGFATMSSPTKEFMTLIVSKKLIHGGNPVLRWQADNLQAEQDAAGNIKPSKAKSMQRIDGIVATIMGIERLMRNAQGESVYKERGLIYL